MPRTLEDVLTDMAMISGDTDRGALVRPAREGKQPGVCVIMTSKPALRRLGKPLLNIARRLGDAREGFGSPEITQKIGLNALFEIADAAPNGWCWASFKFFKLHVTLAIFCRSLEEVARVCNDHGTPCSLNPRQPAPGWEIEKVLDRR